MLQNELSFEMQTFMPSQLEAMTKDKHNQRPVRFTKLVYDLDIMIKKAFRADSTRVIFIPHKNEKSGVFMEGPFNYREMVKVNLKNTLVEKILNNPGCTQITIPSSLICK